MSKPAKFDPFWKNWYLILAVVVGLILGILGLAGASPFVVCDPQAGVQYYSLTGPAWVPTTVTAQADGSIKMDISAALVGSNSITVKACKTDAVWGEQCSVASPFSFTRPAAPAITSNIRLIP